MTSQVAEDLYRVLINEARLNGGDSILAPGQQINPYMITNLKQTDLAMLGNWLILFVERMWELNLMFVAHTRNILT